MKVSDLDAIFIVNLKQDIEKKAHMQSLCNKYDLSSEFISAVDGALLSKDEVDDVYPKDIAIKTNGRELSASEIGCALSHMKIYQKIVDESIGVALVLEDDIEFNNALLNCLKAISILPIDWELILLGHHGGESRHSTTKGSLWGVQTLFSNYKLIRPCEPAYGTYGYLINRQGALKLLGDLVFITKPIDHYTGDSGHVNLYAVQPTPIKIFDYLSDTHHSMKGRDTLVNAQNSLRDQDGPSWYKKLLVLLGIYSFLVVFYNTLKILWNKVKPLRKYKSS